MKFDLIVVGAGIMGTFHAYHAARLGKKVLLLEKDNKPVGSSIQNFGQIVPSGLDANWQKYGQRSLEIYAELQSKTEFTLVNKGSVYIASDPHEHVLIEELAAIRAKENYPVEFLDKAKTMARFPDLNSDYIKGALFFSNEYSVDSSQFIYLLIDFCVETLGVVYKPNAAVVDLEENEMEACVTTADKNRYYAEKVIICSGYIFNLLFPKIYSQSGLVISKLQMLKTVPLPQFNLNSNILTGLSIRRYEAFEACPSYAKLPTPDHLLELEHYGIHILLKQLPDGRIIVGDSHEYAAVQEVESLGLGVKDHINNLIKKETDRMLKIPNEAYESSWAGYYAQHPDGIFEYSVTKSVQIRTGIGGKGMTTSAAYAEEKIRQLYS